MTTTALAWKVERLLGVSRVAVFGEVDLATAPGLEEALLDLHGPVVLDCAEMTFLGSAGLAALARVYAENSSLTLRNVASHCRRVLDIAGMTGLVALEER